MYFVARITAIVLTASSLSGCAAVELAHAVYQATSGNIGYGSDSEVNRQSGKIVYAASFHTGDGYRQKCWADGVAVDYSRGKPTAGASEGLPTKTFNAGEVYGQAIIIYKEACGKSSDTAPARDVVLTGARRQIFGMPVILSVDEKVVTYDYLSANNAHRPDWMPQVLQTIQTQAAAGGKDAKLFLGYIHIKNGEPVTATMEGGK